MNFIDWAEKHWLFLVMLPANILAVDVVIKGAAEKHDFKKISQICDWVANVVGFIQDIVSGLIKKPPTTGGTVAGMALLLIVACGASYADNSPSVTVIDALKAIPAVKSGVLWDYQYNRVLPYEAFEVFTFKGFSADLGLVGTDGVAGSINYNLGTIKPTNMPILNVLNYCYAGWGMGYRTLSVADLTGNPKSDNQAITGPTLFAKIKF